MILCNQCGQPVSGDTNVCLDCFTRPAGESSFDSPASQAHSDRVKTNGNGNGSGGRAGARQTAVAEFEENEDAPTIVAGEREFERLRQQQQTPAPAPNKWKWAAVTFVLISVALVVGLAVALARLNGAESSLAEEQSRRRGLAGSKAELEQTIASLEARLLTAEQELQKTRDARKSLAERWPVTVTEMKLLNGSDRASATEMSPTIHSGSTRYVYWRATLQNNGEETLKGNICVKYINPGGSLYTDAASPSGCTNSVSIELADKDTPPGTGFGNTSGYGFSTGLNRVELWWNGRKIGEKAFYVFF